MDRHKTDVMPPCTCGGAQRIAELTENFRTPEPCGHMKNFLVGDEYGHFTCTLCGIAELEQQLRRARDKNAAAFDAGRDAALELVAGLFQDSMHTQWTQDECVQAVTGLRADMEPAGKAARELAIQKMMEGGNGG